MVTLRLPLWWATRRLIGPCSFYFQLCQLNDIVRLCHRFSLGFDMTSMVGPIVEVEFRCLRDRRMDGIYEVRYRLESTR